MVGSFAQAANGTWDTDSAGNWTDITKWLGDAAYASGTDSTATFGNFITADRIITLDAPITIGNITASDADKNYTISGANILTLDRSSGIPAINVTTSGRTLTISSQIAGLDGLQKIGFGTLTLTGANSYTGDTTVTLGTLNLGGATANGSLASTVLNLGGGTLSYTRTGSTTQNFTTTNIKPGISIASTVAGNTLNLGDLVRDAGGSLNFGNTGSIKTSESNDSSGILGAWATFNGADWATKNGSDVVVAYTAYTTLAGAGPTLASSATTNYRVTSGSTGNITMAATGTIDANTLLINDAAARTSDVRNGTTQGILRFGGFGGLLTSGGAHVIGVATTAGTITAGGADDTSGELIVNNATALTINSVIANNGTGAVSLTKSGAGTLNLSGNNSYTGITTINAGSVLISHANALGTTAGNTTIAATGSTSTGGQLQLTGSINCPENITITGSTEISGLAGAILGSANNTVTLSGNITLSNLAGGVRFATSNAGARMNFTGTISQTGSSQALVFALGNAGGQTVTINNPIALNGGALILTGNGSSVILKGVNATDGSGIGTTTINSGGVGLQLGVTDAINTTATLTVNGNFNLAGFNQTVNELNGSGAVQNSGAGTGTNTLTVGNGGGLGVFDGVINNGTTAKVALTKTGTGAQTLSKANSYSGPTLINGGTLVGVVGGSCSNSAVTVSNPGTLEISIINSTMQWTCASLTLNNGSQLKFNFTGTPSPTTAPLKILGTITFSGTPTIEVVPSTSGTYPLLTITGTPPGTLPTLIGDIGTLKWIDQTLWVVPAAPAGTSIFIR